MSDASFGRRTKTGDDFGGLRRIASFWRRAGRLRARPDGDVDHAAAAAGTDVEASPCEKRGALAIIGGFNFGGRFWSVERGADLRELAGAACVCEEAEMADATEAFGQDVLQKAAHELVGVERHRLGLAAGAIIFPSETNAVFGAVEKPAIGDGNAMGVAAEVVEDLAWTAERALGVDEPFDAALRGEIGAEGGRFGERRLFAEKLQAGGVERRAEAFKEPTTIEARQNVDRKEEVGPTGDPSPIRPETAARNNAVDVRVMRERLPPSMQDRNHACFGAEMARVGADAADRLRRRLEQDVIDDSLVLQGQRRDGRRHGEDDVKIRNRQQFGAAVGEPLKPRQPLALRTMPVATGIISDADRAAVLALLDVSAKRWGAARFDGGHHATLLQRKPFALRGAKRLAVTTKNVGHLKRGTHRRGSIGRKYLKREAVERARNAGDEIGGDPRIARCR